MNIGLGGRIGAGIALSAAIADASTWIIRAIDNYPFGFYRWTDAFLPVIFVFGLSLILPSSPHGVALWPMNPSAHLIKYFMLGASVWPPSCCLQAS